VFFENWREKLVWQRKSDGRFFYIRELDDGDLMLIDLDSGAEVEAVAKRDMKNLKPNSGVRAVIASALVQFQLSDPDPKRRLEALTALERNADASHLSVLRAAIESETDPVIKARKVRLELLLTIQFGTDQAARIAAIESFSGDADVDVRAALNPLVTTRLEAHKELPDARRFRAPISTDDVGGRRRGPTHRAARRAQAGTGFQHQRWCGRGCSGCRAFHAGCERPGLSSACPIRPGARPGDRRGASSRTRGARLCRGL
jgi:hypothetical protein